MTYSDADGDGDAATCRDADATARGLAGAPVGMLRIHARTLVAISLVAVASRPAHFAVAQPDHRPVFAYYYAWWNSDTFGATIEYPTGNAAGASDDPGVLSDSIRQARA